MSHTDKNVFTEEHIGRRVKFYLEDGTLFTGVITSFPNDEHMSVLVDHKWDGWSWYVRNEAVLFV